MLSARGLARVYTDYLWFKEVHFSQTWRGLIEAKAFPALIFSVIFFIAMFVDLIVADRLAPLSRNAGPEDEIVERYRNVVEPYAGRIRFGVAAFFAVVMASGVASEWRDWILFSPRPSSASRIRSSIGTSASTCSSCRSSSSSRAGRSRRCS